MTKKFTEAEYQKIVEIADRRLNNTSVIEVYILDNIYLDVQKSSTNEEQNKFKELNQQLALIAIPKSRDWAHEQFVEKGKKYRWRHKKNDNEGDPVYIDIDDYGVMAPHSFYSHQIDCQAFTESEVIEAGYNPDYYWKEEVE